MPGFAFFDLDHTLLPFDTQPLFANFVLRRERWRTVYLLGVAPLGLLRAVKLAPTVLVKRAFLNFLWGMKRERLQCLAREFADTEVLRRVYPELRAIILHNAAEELEHASMVLEWIRRNDREAATQLREYLFSDGSIVGHEEDAGDKYGL